MATSMEILSKYLPGTENGKTPKSKKKKNKNKKARKAFQNQQNKRLKMEQNNVPMFQGPCPPMVSSPMHLKTQDGECNPMNYPGPCPQTLSSPMCFPTENNQHNFAAFQGACCPERVAGMCTQQPEDHDGFPNFRNPYPPPELFNPVRCVQADQNQSSYNNFHGAYPPDSFNPVCNFQANDQNDFHNQYLQDCVVRTQQTESQSSFQMFHNPYPPDGMGPVHLQVEDGTNSFGPFPCGGYPPLEQPSPMCTAEDNNSDLAPFHNPYPPELPNPAGTKFALLPTPPPDKYMGPPLQVHTGPGSGRVSPPPWVRPYVPEMSPHFARPPPPPLYFSQPPPPSLPPPPLPPPPDEPPPPSPPPQEAFHCPPEPNASGFSAGLLCVAPLPAPSDEPKHKQGSVDASVRPTNRVPVTSQPPQKKVKLQASSVSCVQTELHIKAVISTTKMKLPDSRRKKVDSKRLKEMQRRERKRKQLLRMKHEAKYKQMRKQEGAMLRKNPYIDLEEIRLVTADISIKSIKISTGLNNSSASSPQPKGILVSAGFREMGGVKDGEKKVCKTVRFVESDKPTTSEIPRPRTATKKKLCSKERQEKAARRAARLDKKRVLAACVLLPPPPPPSIEPPPCLRLLAAREPPAGLMWACHKFKAKKARVDELLSTVAPHLAEPRAAPPPPAPPPPAAPPPSSPHHGPAQDRSPASPFDHQRIARPGFALPLKFPLSQIKPRVRREHESPMGESDNYNQRPRVIRGPHTPPPPPSPPHTDPPWCNSAPKGFHPRAFAFDAAQRRPHGHSPLPFHGGRCNGDRYNGDRTFSPSPTPNYSPRTLGAHSPPSQHRNSRFKTAKY